MNECLRYQEMISALIDGEISGEEHSALLEHMESCRQCSAMYTAFLEVSAIAAEDIGELPESLHENIMAGVRRAAIEKNNRRRGVRHFKSIIAAAACFAVVLFAVGGAVTELSRRAAVKTEATLAESTDMTVMTDAVATMDVQAAGTANAAVYAQANMSTPTPVPEIAVDAYDADETAVNSALAEDPYLSRPEPTAARSESIAPPENVPAYEALPENVPAYEALPESVPGYEALLESTPAPAAETPPPHESLIGTNTDATAVFAAPALSPEVSAKSKTALPADITEAISPETKETVYRLEDKLILKDLTAAMIPSLTAETKTAELPEGYCDTLYILRMSLDGSDTEELFALRYGELLYLFLPDGQETSGIYQAQCTVAVFEQSIAPFLSAEAE